MDGFPTPPQAGPTLNDVVPTSEADDATMTPTAASKAAADAQRVRSSQPNTVADVTSTTDVAPPPGILSRAWTSLASIPSEIANPTPATASGSPGVGKEFGEGFVRGIHDVASPPTTWLLRQLGVGDAATKQAADRQQQFEQQYGSSPVASVGRTVGQTVATLPVTSGAGALVGRGAVALPGMAGRVAGFLAGTAPAEGVIGRGVQLAGQGAATGATQAGLTSSASDQPLGDQLATGAAVGGVAGPVIGGLTKAVDMLRGYVGGVRPEIAALADKARQLYRVNIPAPSMLDNPTLRMMADQTAKWPFSGADAAALASQRQIQGAIANQMGSDANTFGPATMKAAADKLSQGYTDALAKVPNVVGGQPLVDALSDIGTDASKYTVGDATTHVGRAIREVADAFKSGPITPEAYRSLTGSDGPLAKISNAAPSAAQDYLGRIRDTLKDRLIASSPPGVADDLNKLDAQWRAMKTIQPLAAKSTLGDISPGGLQQQVINQSNRFDGSVSGKAYTGGGALGDLGDIGKQFFGAIPDSGTAARLQAMDPVKAAMMAVPGVASRRFQSWLRGPTVSGRVIDTSLGRPTPNIGRAIPYGLLGAIDAARQ
jgi:hypothetical protein